jgi:NADH:ubiquinone oxidoreductase subunit 2 (subunit N)
MSLILNYINLEELTTFGLSLVLINIVNYLLIFLPIMIIILNCDVSKIKNLNQFKEFNSNSFILSTVIFSLLSMAGIPPLLGFTGKFLSILFLSFKSQYFLLLITLILNMFSMYFYIQNLRFLVKKTKSTILCYKNYYVSINYSLNSFIVFLNLINIFGFLFISDFLIIFNFIVSNIY